MLYKSTRGGPERKSFEEALLSTYAPDGGMYIPETIPIIDSNVFMSWKDLSFPQIVAAVFSQFCDIPLTPLEELCNLAYADFNDGIDHLPLRKFDSLYLLDTSLGPTLAFKDIGQQILGKLINYILSQQGRVANIIVETSGDTGPAAIAGVKGSSNVNIFCLYPYQRVSNIQELQMITIPDTNVYVYRTDGNTDEQASVLKELFTDIDFMTQNVVFSVNSINIGRIIAQSAYFLWLSFRFVMPDSDEKGPKLGLKTSPFNVIIPSGACGNAAGALFARMMGAPIKQIICATNLNDIVTRTILYGDLRMGENQQTVSPAMDIQFAYNLERILYYCSNENTALVGDLMSSVLDTTSSAVQLDTELLSSLQSIFSACTVSNEETLSTIKTFYEQYDFLLCPHSATAVFAALHPFQSITEDASIPTVAILTAHPDKFPATISLALEGCSKPPPPVGEKVQHLLDKPHRFQWLHKDLDSNDNSNSNKKGDENIGWRKAWIEKIKEDVRSASKVIAKEEAAA